MLNKNKIKQFIFEKIYLLSAILAALFLVVIILFILSSAIPAFKEYGFIKMLFSFDWSPGADPQQFGLASMILSTIVTTIIALGIAVPVGILCAVFLSKMATSKLKASLLFIVELLASIPSVVFGFFILKTLVKVIYDSNMHVYGVSGNSMLAAIVVLALMTLPTIISVSTTALDAVDKSYMEASLALGANKIQSIFKVDIRAARNGIMASVVLGAGKVIGETMAVMLVSGNAINNPDNLLQPIRTLTANIATEMAYASGTHQAALYATGIILFIMIMILNYILLVVMKRGDANAK
ncbi:MAG: phosphate ABC transporter permease subunit PstC [Erysipelotrichales bacterium]